MVADATPTIRESADDRRGRGRWREPREIAARAGHTSVVTVLDRYGHLLPHTADEVTDALDRLAAMAQPTTAEVVAIGSRDGRGIERTA